MRSFVSLLVLSGLFCSTRQQQISLEDALQDIFQYPTIAKPADDARGCKCVPYYLCSKNNSTLPDGRGVLDLSLSKGDGPCAHYMDSCCDPLNIENKIIAPSDTKKPGCGWRNDDGVGFRLIGEGNETKFGEFPWTVALLHREQFQEISMPLIRYVCSGSLVHPQAVVTSAHCVTERNQNYIVRIGEWDTQTTKEIYPTQDRDVTSITVHPGYYSRTLFDDIAFLVLDSPVDMSYPNVGLACLPPQGTLVQRGTRCFAAGWGKNMFGRGGMYAVILKKIDLPIVDRTTCQNNLRQTRLGKYFELHESFICAGGEEGKDTCTGDGGGPLMCPIPGQEGRYQQVGIVAWGIGCGSTDVPGVYTHVALLKNWIDQQMIGHGLSATTYEY